MRARDFRLTLHAFVFAQCIRSVLPDKPECPTCRKNASEIHLRKDLALESVVKAWSTARYVSTRCTFI